MKTSKDMNKELQDRAWAALPAVFRENMREDYKCPRNDKYDEGWDACLESYFGEHNLTSAAEPEDNPSICRNKSQNCDKSSGNPDERRLNITAMAMQGIMANPHQQMVEMGVKAVANLSVLIADSLIAESEKGGIK